MYLAPRILDWSKPPKQLYAKEAAGLAVPRQRGAAGGFLTPAGQALPSGWRKFVSHHVENIVETITFVGIYRQNIRKQGFLGGAKCIFVHSQYSSGQLHQD